MRRTSLLALLAAVVALLCAASRGARSKPSLRQGPPAQAAPGTSPGAPPQNPDDANARKARQIVDQLIQAMGGQAYLTYQSYEQEGRYYSFHHGESEGTGIPFWRFWQWPDKERQELTKQRDVVETFNGDNGWETTYRGTHPQEPEALRLFLRRREFSIETVLRRWLNEPGTVLYYAGDTMTEQKAAQQVDVSNARGETVSLFIDTFTHFLIKKTFKARNEKYHDFDVEEEIWDNYRPVQGIQTAQSYTRKQNGDMVVQRFLTKTIYNQQQPEAFFVPRNAPAMLPSKK